MNFMTQTKPGASAPTIVKLVNAPNTAKGSIATAQPGQILSLPTSGAKIQGSNIVLSKQVSIYNNY